jgi:hypothetical protein
MSMAVAGGNFFQTRIVFSLGNVFGKEVGKQGDAGALRAGAEDTLPKIDLMDGLCEAEAELAFDGDGGVERRLAFERH